MHYLDVFVFTKGIYKDLLDRIYHLAMLPEVSSICVMLDGTMPLLGIDHLLDVEITKVRFERVSEGLAPSSVLATGRMESRSRGRIGSLRNIALSKIDFSRPATILFLDDDISVSNRTLLMALAASYKVALSIVGCRIGGFDSRDSLTQMLADAGIDSIGEPIAANQRILRGTAHSEVLYVSGGFLMFPASLAGTQLPFPVSYNEAWLWCLINRLGHRIPSIQVDEPVEHLRRSSLASSIEDLILEQLGVLVGRVLKRSRATTESGEDSIFSWLRGDEAAALAKLLSPAVRLNDSLRCADDVQLETINSAFGHRFGCDLNAATYQLAKTDWHELMGVWCDDYLTLQRNFRKQAVTCTEPSY